MAGKKEKKKKCHSSDCSMYSAIRPLAIFANIVGTMPLKGLWQRDGTKISYKFYSFANIWGFVVFSVCLGVLAWVSTGANGYVNVVPKDGHWKLIACVMLAIRAFFQFLICHIKAKNLPLLIKMLERSYFCRLEFKNSEKKWKYGLFTTTMGYIGLIMFEDFLFYSSMLPTEEEALFSIPFSFLRLWQVLPLVFCVVFMTKIEKGFIAINKNLSSTLKDLKMINKEKQDAKLNVTLDLIGDHLEWLQTQHAGLINAVNQVTRTYGLLMAVDYVVMVCIIVVNLFTLIDVEGEYNLLYITWTMNNFMPCILVLLRADRLSNQAKESVVKLRVIWLPNLDSRVQLKLKGFLNHVQSNPVQVSAARFFPLNRTRIVSVIGTISAYLMVMLQYKSLYDMKQEENEDPAPTTADM